MLLPRPEYSVFPLELPAFSRKEREQAVANRLRGEYPGTLDEQTVVVLPNGKGRYLAVVMAPPGDADPVSLSTLALRRLRRKGRRYCVVAVPGWIEYVRLENGSVVSSAVSGWDGEPLETALAGQAGERFAHREEDGPQVVEVFCEPPYRREELSAGPLSFRFISLETALGKVSRASYSCFPGRLAAVRRRRLAAAALSFSAAVVLAFVVRGWYAERQAARQAERERSRLAAEEAARYEAGRQGLAELEAAWREQAEGEPVTVYETLEILASCLSPSVRVVQATVKEGGFQLEGTCADALAALKQLVEHERVACTIQTVIRDAGGERFTAAGTVSRTLPAGIDAYPPEKRRSFYEAELARFRERQALRAEHAAAAGETVLGLFERNRCTVQRIRYLEAEGGWILEASVNASGMQLVRVIGEAAGRYPFRVTAVQTRNLGGSIEAVVTFFVRGPGGVRREGEYEEHPSAGRIAALYGTAGTGPVPVQPALPAAVPAPAAPEPPPVPRNPRAADLEYVGFIGTGDGARHVYVKDLRSGDLLRLTEGAENYGYVLSGTGTVTARIDGALVEVRRSDGF
jgi:hypothetical protein